MRKLFLLLSFLLVFTETYSQKIDTAQSGYWTKESLIKKSRTQKGIGWFMVGTGVPVAIACLYFLTFPDDALSEKGKVVLALLGSTAYTFIGVDLISKGRKNMQRAVELSIHPPKLWLPSSKGWPIHSQLTVALHVPL